MCSPFCRGQKHVVPQGGRAAVLAVAVAVASGGSARAYAQDTAINKREVPAIRLSSPPIVDGDLSDPAWQHSAHADRFTDELFGNPVQNQTEVYLGYDEKNIYVAFHAFDSQPPAIVARETKRGVFPQGDDIVAFSIDPFHNHKDRSIFIVNARGTQVAFLSGGRATKLEWEGKWQAAAKIVADGWTAEMAIPWSILNYPAIKGPTTVGINFDRRQERTKIHSWWSNLGAQEFFDLDGHWAGVQLPPFRPQLSLLPYASPGWVENGGIGFRSGLDLRSRLTPTLTVVGTVNPDFQNVQEAVESIDFSYGERFVPDSRPFFQEGADVYSIGSGVVAGQYFYSRRVGAFDTGVNLYGKLAPRDTLGVLAALDLGHEADWVLRGQHELGATSSLGLALLNRDDEPLTNRALVLTGATRKGFWGTDLSWAGSTVGELPTGSTTNLAVHYQSPRWFASVTPNYTRPGFRDDLGFIPFTDFEGVTSNVAYSTEWRRGALRSASAGWYTEDSHHYNGELFRQERQLFFGLQSRRDYELDFNWTGGRFEEFRDSVFTTLLRARTSDPFHNVGLLYSRGRRAGAPYTFIAPSATWRFRNKLTLGLASSLLFHLQDAQQQILTFNYDFSPQQGISGRLVAQTGGTNAYFAYRHSGYGGTETFLIFGDPNAAKFRQRLVLKVVWAM
jgi:hypothetical protein